MKNDHIIVKGARENNLKSLDVKIPKNKFVVMTGLSGSGKSSLAFETLYQEGQRRYMESLSSYARQFLGNFKKPDVDVIEGLSPSISIDQRTTSNNPRSTVGTVTEIYDYLRLIYAKIGTPYCPGTNNPLERQSIEEMTNKVLTHKNKKVLIMAPVIEKMKGQHQKVVEEWLKEGFVRVCLNGQIYEIEDLPKIEKNKKNSLYVVVDRVISDSKDRSRIYDALEICTKLADGKALVDIEGRKMNFSQKYSCKNSSFSIPVLEPRLFSFNTPIGACPSCNGLGQKLYVSENLVLDLNKPIFEGGIIPYKNNNVDNLYSQILNKVCKENNIPTHVSMEELSREDLNIILYGTKKQIKFDLISSSGRRHEKVDSFEGVINNLNRRYIQTTSEWIRTWIENFMDQTECSECHGARLNEKALSVKINNINIHELTSMSINKILNFFIKIDLKPEQKQIGRLAIEEIKARLMFLKDVGLEYLTLSRSAATLSGGEAQRIRLATQIGSKLTGVVYVLDEPSIGLHQRDNMRLIRTLKKMRDLGNTLVVVEHDHETMLESDYLIDIGPRAGHAGGKLIAAGTPKEVMENKNSITGLYLKGEISIETPKKRRKSNGKELFLVGAKENNLKNLNISFPLSVLTVVTGVSGSGKSTLVNKILLKRLQKEYYKIKENPGMHDHLEGMSNIDRVIEISQSPIGRTPRSNPATYTGVFNDIRELFSTTMEAKMRGYKKGRFSFNVRGGRCESCNGDGVKKISMHFLPDVFVKCEVCKGSRYNNETLQIRYKGQNVSDVLSMTIEKALDFFNPIPKIKSKLQTLFDVGLGYLTLGQAATTLSGGEAQRVKLASELYKRITEKSIYILDEPTTGLHSEDVNRLIKVIQRIVDQGATMIIIEHNLDIIKNADHVIDLGPEGGEKGGSLVASGTPEKVSENKDSYTGKFLKSILSKK